MSAPSVKLVEPPDEGEVLAKYAALQKRHQQVVHDAWIGALVLHFDNEELRILADSLCIGDTLDLRRLGLLASDEGYDGTKESRKRSDANQKARRDAGASQ